MKQRSYLTNWSHSIWAWLGVVVVLVAGLFYLVEDVAYANRVLPGVYLGDLNLSGRTKDQVQQAVDQLVKDLSHQKITFQLDDWQATYTLKELGVVWLTPKMVQAVWKFGREPQSPLLNFGQRLWAIIAKVQVGAVYHEQMDWWDQSVSKLRQQVDRVGVDGDVIIGHNKATIKPAVTGRILDGTKLHQMIGRRFKALNWDKINLPVQLAPPVFNDELTRATADKINENLSKGYQLVARDRHWDISSDQLWQWVEVVKQNNSLVVRLKPADLDNYFKDLKEQVDQPVEEAVFVMQDKKVSKFQPDQPGVNLHSAAAAGRMQSTLLTSERDIDLPADYVEPKVKLADLNDLGINELISRGESNFKGSPVNRRHNIKVGKDKFDRVLVAPNEVFSFNKTLGVVDDTTGYLPELVIKGDETTPEFGGGLCQVSTTAFRAALLGGYEIKERHNHTYRVSYYEPAGTDATVYQPYPDIKFLNDTPYYILIHTWIDGDNLYFDFYSTKAGRRVELEGPRIYNITEPPEPIYIETSDLPEGETKKIDTAHRGADAAVYRHIYDDKGHEIRKDTFKSFYIPWPAKYLIGAKVAPKVETNLGNVPPDATATETPPVNVIPTS